MALDPRTRAAAYDRVGTTADIDEGLRKYMLSVYNYMALGVAFTGVVTLFVANSPGLLMAIAGGGFWVLFIGILGLGWFAPKIMTTKSVAAAHACYWVYAALWGLLIAPMIYAFLAIPGGTMDIARAFFITAGMFAGASLYGYTTKRDLSGFARFLMMATIGLLIAILVNVFFVESTMFSFITSILVVLVFAAITAWETQQIKTMYREADPDIVTRMAIFGAFMLYGTFVVMFIHILNLIGIMRGD